MDTLVLNSSYEPLGLIHWEKAINLLFRGKAEVVEEYDKELRSVSVTIKIPSIVRLIKWNKYRRKGVKFSRENVYARDKGKCQYCGKKVPRNSFTFDHVTPRAQGGKTEFANIVVACIPCNQKKRDRTPEQAGMKLLTKPVHPVKLPESMRIVLGYRNGMPESWKQWLIDMAYWNGTLEEG